ncbi:MAG: hypothetical protein KGR26_03180 [Cyanobacteria bacterium REEB65]|nr:hypothetical protein [Cyanobacteria bacterium REEB65]
MGRKKPAPSSREVRQRHESAIATLGRQRADLVAEIAGLEARKHELEGEYLHALVDLVTLLELLEESHEDAEWVRRKALIRAKTRQLLDRQRPPSDSGLASREVPPALAKRLHSLVSDIQQHNEYAHVTGDYAAKTDLQNRILERYARHLEVTWDGDRELLIEFKGRSAGHIPVSALTPKARTAIAPTLGLKLHSDSQDG